MTLVSVGNVALVYDDYRRSDSLYERVNEYANLSHATMWTGVQLVTVSLTALGTGVVTV